MSAALAPATGNRALAALYHRRWDLLALGLVLLVVMVVQFRYLKSPWLYDSVTYYSAAAQWPDVAAYHRSLRVGLIVPVKVAQVVFGYSEASWYAVPLASLALLSASTFALGRMLFGRFVGIAAGLLVALNPYVLTWSAQIFPDVPSAALFTASVVLLTYVGRRRRNGQPLTWQDYALLVASGLVLGWAYLVREFIVLLAPVHLAVAFAYRLRWRALLTIAAAAVAVLGAELALNAAVHDDPFVRIREMVDKKPIANERQRERFEAQRPDQSIVARVTVLNRLLLGYSTGIWFTVMLVLAPIGAVIDRKRRILPLLTWMVMIYAVLVGVTFVQINGRSLLRPTLIRYWYPFLVPLCVAGLGAAQLLAARIPDVGRRIGVAAVAVLTLASGWTTVQAMERQPGTYTAGATEFRQLRTYLATSDVPHSTLWTDARVGRVIDVFTTSTFGEPLWTGETRWLNTARSFGELDRISEGDLVLVEDEFFRPRQSNWRGAVPDWYLELPDDWDLRWVSTNSELALFEVAAGDDVDVTDRLPQPTTWTAIPRRGDTITTPVVLEDGQLTLPQQERSRLVADDATPGAADGGVEVEAGAYVRFRVPLTADGAGNVVPMCVVEGDDGRAAWNIHVVSTWGVPSPAGTVLGGVCRAPISGTWTLALNVRGPIELDVGSITARLDADGRDG